MKIVKDPKEMQSFSESLRASGKSIAFVPTMGYLHAGHLSLVEAARRKADIVVVSIYVNPTQFGPKEDLARYPKDLKRDQKLLNGLDIDILFIPRTQDMYPEGFNSFVEVQNLSQKLCGISRPTHFRGVTTIVAKLFSIIAPDYAFFGVKDFQQLTIIKRMVKDLDLPVKIIGQPTVREFDGLAMSSRNKYLSAKQRKAATVLYRALSLAKQEIKNGARNPKKIIQRMRSLIKKEPSVKLDYLAIVDPESLENIQRIKGEALFALAAYIGKTRLIDNLLIEA
jgi:pantoate--beta-alanine ligase